MIQINLIPDVKQELIRAQRQRAAVVSISIIVSIAAVAAMALLAVYIYGGQTLRNQWADNQIRDLSSELAGIDDLSNSLTIQNQLAKIPELHRDKQMSSRLFVILSTIDPPAPNNMTIASVDLSTESTLITIEGYAEGGFSALEVFKKTIEATKVHIGSGDNAEVLDLVTRVDIDETSYGESGEGKRVLRFAVSLAYNPEVFSGNSETFRVVAPNRENATDSYRRLPQSLFGDQARDIEEAN